MNCIQSTCARTIVERVCQTAEDDAVAGAAFRRSVTRRVATGSRTALGSFVLQTRTMWEA